MIIVKIFGGLGNQMFQYAFGRQLAVRNGVPVKLDLSWFRDMRGYTSRNYGLSAYGIKAEEAAHEEIKSLKNPGMNVFHKLTKVIAGYPMFYKKKSSHIIQRGHGFDERACHIQGDFYLEGYWQSEKYFEDIHLDIRSEFRLKLPLTGDEEILRKKMSEGNAVSIHVRRGDYLQKPNNSIFASCSETYYRQATELISERVRNPKYYIFSDDLKWVSDNLNLDHPKTFVHSRLPDRDPVDVFLMSLCRFNIIANSSFSWWGAWLNENPGKVVIAPKIWFKSRVGGNNKW